MRGKQRARRSKILTTQNVLRCIDKRHHNEFFSDLYYQFVSMKATNPEKFSNKPFLLKFLETF